MYSVYGIVRRKEDDGEGIFYAVHEVFFTESGKLIGISEYPAIVDTRSLEGMSEIFGMLREAANNGQCLAYEDCRRLDLDDVSGEILYQADGELPEQNCETSFTIS